MDNKRLLILNGSTRKKGTSFSFGRTLEAISTELGHEAEIAHVYDYYDGKASIDSLLKSIQNNDIICMVAPLYVDTLPAPDIWLLEKLRDDHLDLLEGKGFMAIGQSGFPDIKKCQPLIATCMYFAKECHMEWLGGLAYGGGAMLDGAPLETLGKKGKKITKGFRVALEAVFANKSIPKKSQDLITVKMPKLFYRPLAALMNKLAYKKAKENGISDLRIKTYLVE